MRIILASDNKGKINEFEKLLNPLGIELIPKSDISTEEIKETGKDFYENAYLKAYALYEKSKLPTVADDSGLEVESLSGKPGVNSARYASENNKAATDAQNIDKLLKELNGNKNRKARFVCVICYIDNYGKSHYFDGECHGEIALKKDGNNGFGYDPVFLYNKKSFARFEQEEKNKVSHRGLATKKFIEYMEKNND